MILTVSQESCNRKCKQGTRSLIDVEFYAEMRNPLARIFIANLCYWVVLRFILTTPKYRSITLLPVWVDLSRCSLLHATYYLCPVELCSHHTTRIL